MTSLHPGPPSYAAAAGEQVAKQLKLRPEHHAPMVEPFLRYGNTSSSSTWCACALSTDTLLLYVIIALPRICCHTSP